MRSRSGGGSAIDAGPGAAKARQHPATLYHDVVEFGRSDVRVVSGVPTNARWPDVVLQVGRPLDENDRVLHDLSCARCCSWSS